MGKQKEFLRHLADRMDLQAEPIPGKPALELLGENRLVVEHHQGILDYSREEILIRVNYGSILVTGENLELSFMSDQQLIITGRIGNLKLNGGRPC